MSASLTVFFWGREKEPQAVPLHKWLQLKFQPFLFSRTLLFRTLNFWHRIKAFDLKGSLTMSAVTETEKYRAQSAGAKKTNDKKSKKENRRETSRRFSRKTDDIHYPLEFLLKKAVLKYEADGRSRTLTRVFLKFTKKHRNCILNKKCSECTSHVPCPPKWCHFICARAFLEIRNH